MHAWPELYFQGIGWVRFEPTPAARVAQHAELDGRREPRPDQPDARRRAPRRSRRARADDPEIDRPNGDRNLPTDSGVAAVGGGNWFTNGGGRLIGIVGRGDPAALHPVADPQPDPAPRGSPESPAELGPRACGPRSGTPPATSDWTGPTSPRRGRPASGSSRSCLLTRSPQAIRLARGIEALRYAGDASPTVDLRAEAAAVRKALWTQAPRLRRWRARLLPPSWRWYLNRGSTEASDLLDEFDLLLARLRSLALRRRHAG